MLLYYYSHSFGQGTTLTKEWNVSNIPLIMDREWTFWHAINAYEYVHNEIRNLNMCTLLTVKHFYKHQNVPS